MELNIACVHAESGSGSMYVPSSAGFVRRFGLARLRGAWRRFRLRGRRVRGLSLGDLVGIGGSSADLTPHDSPEAAGSGGWAPGCWGVAVTRGGGIGSGAGAAGTGRIFWHLGHLACLPAAESGTDSIVPHAHRNWIIVAFSRSTSFGYSPGLFRDDLCQ